MTTDIVDAVAGLASTRPSPCCAGSARLSGAVAKGVAAAVILDVTGSYSLAIVDGTVSQHGDPSGELADLVNCPMQSWPRTRARRCKAGNARTTVDLVRSTAVTALAELYAGME